jgi:alkylglycerol monooxygenase
MQGAQVIVLATPVFLLLIAVEQPDDVAKRFPKAPFDIRQAQRFDLPASRAARWMAAMLFVLFLLATLMFPWVAHTWPLAQQLAAVAAIVVGLLIVGALCATRGTILRSAQRLH